MAARIDVVVPDESNRGYPILIKPGALANIDAWRDSLGLKGLSAIITNTTLAPLYGLPLSRALGGAPVLVIADGEQYKTLDTLASLYHQMLAAGLDRSSTVIALGGGVVGDVAGYAAASYMRGIRFVQVPTTLLAMVDSSVGGKVGVDAVGRKNFVGAFYHPTAVLVDPRVLDTLPLRQWRCGLAEVIKHGLLADRELLDLVIAHEYGRSDPSPLIARAVKVKVDIVHQDPKEAGIRAYLNLGHTFGHAIEMVSRLRFQHGEAVAIGLVAATRLSARLGLSDENLATLTEQLVSRVGLPVRMGNLDLERLWATMCADKKWSRGQTRFVLLEGIGRPTIKENIEKCDVMTVLEGLQ
jgi:3-dehydroquinate synthase